MRHATRIFGALLIVCAIVGGTTLTVPAAGDAKIIDIVPSAAVGGFSVVVRADAPLSAAVSQDGATFIVRLAQAILPPSFPNFQSVNDALVVSISAAQTSIAPATATLAINVRGSAKVQTQTSDAGKTLTLTFAAQGISGASSASAQPSPSTVASALSVPAASLASGVVRAPPIAVRTQSTPVAAQRTASARRETAAIALANISAAAAASALRPLFPNAAFRVQTDANALTVVAPGRDLGAIRAVIAGIDLQGATRRVTDAVALRNLRAKATIPLLRAVFTRANFLIGPSGTVVIVATPADLSSIRAFIASLDVVPPPAAATTTSEVLRLSRASTANVAAALGPAFRAVRFTPSGSVLVVSGPIADVEKIKTLVAAADVAPAGALGVQIYKIRLVAALDVAVALRKAYPSVQIVEDAATNAIVVKGTDLAQAQVAAAIALLDVAPTAGVGVVTAVIPLQYAVPSVSASGSTSASDVATALTSILGPSYPDLRVTVPANTTMLAITGSTATIAAARDLLGKIDVPTTQLVLDTAIYEVDETAARNIGLQLPGAVISSTFTELSPAAPANGFQTAPPNSTLRSFGRTPITFQAQLNFLVNNGTGRVLANPRITTISGRVATIRAGDNIPYVQTNTSGLVGTVTNTVLTFQTGVTLEITPIANPDGRVSVTIHPVVNTLTGKSDQGVPTISTREAQTTVNLRDNETVVIGGLIQESNLGSNSKIPFLGDLPLVGGAFRNKSYNTLRNELIIVVTPHIIPAGSSPSVLQSPPVLPTSRLAPYRTPGPG